MKTITYSDKDQNWANETTTYWFDVDGVDYGVVEGGPDSTSEYVDTEGFPINVEDPQNVWIPKELIVTDDMRLA